MEIAVCPAYPVAGRAKLKLGSSVSDGKVYRITEDEPSKAVYRKLSSEEMASTSGVLPVTIGVPIVAVTGLIGTTVLLGSDAYRELCAASQTMWLTGVLTSLTWLP